jgi:hypothetical protein
MTGAGATQAIRQAFLAAWKSAVSADDLAAKPCKSSAAYWPQAGFRRISCLQRQVLSLQEPLAKPSWPPALRPYQPASLATQFMLNVSFVEASAMSAIGHERSHK